MKKLNFLLYPIVAVAVSVVISLTIHHFDSTKQRLWFYVMFAIWMLLLSALSFLFSKKHLLKLNHLKFAFIYSLSLTIIVVLFYYLFISKSDTDVLFYFGIISFLGSEMGALLGFSANKDFAKAGLGNQIQDTSSYRRTEITLFPIISLIASLNPVLMINGLSGDLGDVAVALLILFFWIVLFIPIFSYLYSYEILKNSDRKIQRTTLNALATCAASAAGPLLFEIKKVKWRYDTPMEMWGAQLLQAVVYMVLLFTWCEMWGLLGVIRQHSAQSQKTGEIATEESHNNYMEDKKKFLYAAFSFILSLFIGSVLWVWHPNNSSVFIFKKALFWAWITLFMPASSFLYSWFLLRKYKSKIGYTFFHSLVIFLSYTIMQQVFMINAELNILIIFAWCEVWALLGLIGKRTKKQIDE